MGMITDKDSPQMTELKKQTDAAITLGETCKAKRESDPTCNFKAEFLKNYD